MKANWFVALPVPAEPWFERAFERTSGPPPGVRLFHPDDLHLTVAFLGSVGEEAARRAFTEARDFPLTALEVELGAVVPMGNPRRPSALSARLTHGEREVARAITSVRDAVCDAAGAPREHRPALPHLTLARPRRTATYAERVAALRWAAALELGAPRVQLSEVALYTWSEQRSERLFALVERVSLRAAAPA
jgi:RNA 2',3'-cyclic 3'-phosphodiesterase